MILIARPPLEPLEIGPGVGATLTHCEDYDLNPDWHRSTKGRFAFERNLYGCDVVRQELQRAQHSKCCYCEARFRHAAPGDVEHFRPKAGWKQERSSRLQRPGYYWLAYSWTNLLWSCLDCNRQAKANLFPLGDPAARALDHHHRWEDESPLLIDPTGPVDPRLHIRFEEEVAKGITPEGECTIEVVKLNREPLLEERWDYLEKLRALRAAALGASHEAAWATHVLERAVLPQLPFSAMAQDFLNRARTGTCG